MNRIINGLYKFNGQYCSTYKALSWLSRNITQIGNSGSCKSGIAKTSRILANIALAIFSVFAYVPVLLASLLEAGSRHLIRKIKFSLISDKEYLKNTDPKVIGALYQTMQVTMEIFQKHGITHWLTEGSALGYVRHGTIIPWDDDIDLILTPEDEAKLLNQDFLNEDGNRDKYDNETLSLHPGEHSHEAGDVEKLVNPEIQADFAARGFKILADNWQGFKIFPISCPDFGKPQYHTQVTGWVNTPHIDIYVTKRAEVDGRVKYEYTKTAKKYWPKAFFYEDEVFPLKKLPFGPIEVYVANENEPHLDRAYGKDWSKVAYRTYDHIEEKALPKRKIKITKFEPSAYTYPYENIEMPKPT